MNKDETSLLNSAFDDVKKLYDLMKSNTPSVEKSIFPRNRIIFGAPGTGKSDTLNKNKVDLLKDGGDFERVTFHPDYSYANFVGCYKPVMRKNNDSDKSDSDKNTDEIAYDYVPGPFIRVLVNALKDEKREHKHLLIIEEINRANVAAVFGDVFQLLDRDNNGDSEYDIHTSEDLKKYLEKEGLDGDIIEKLKIPSNMYIWATMNSADQGVFPMDTAFKRRWNFKYISIDNNEKEIKDAYILIKDKKVNWNSLRKAINTYLSDKGINEDKLMGPFFLSVNEEITMDILKYKVLMYLHEDVVKHRNIELYDKKDGYETNTFSGLCDYFDEFGIDIFNTDILNEIEYSVEKPITEEQNKPTDDEKSAIEE